MPQSGPRDGVRRTRTFLDVVYDKLRITPDADKPARAPSIEPRQAKEIHAMNRGNAAHMDGLDAAIEDRQVNPAIVSAKADAPHDRRDSGRAIVEFRSLPRRRPQRTVIVCAP